MGSVVRAITTFNAAGREQYGKRMVETFRLYWPREVELRVYEEGFSDGGVPLDVPWQRAFKERNRHRKFADFRWDAVRFSHKVAAVVDGSRDCDYAIWVDGDVVTHRDVTLADIQGWMPQGGEYISWLWRTNKYPECGFYLLNCRHRLHGAVMDEMVRLYDSDAIYALPEQHDSYVLQQVVETLGAPWKSLSGKYESHSHPFVNGPLGAFMDHLKGQRKVLGRSQRGDLVNGERNEGWWNAK